MFHSITWLCWTIAVLVALSSTRNPFYVGLILGCIIMVTWSNRSLMAQNAHKYNMPISPFRFGLIVISLSAIFNGLSVHVGQSILFRLPRSWPLVGGIITLEAIIFGILNGLVLTGIFSVFMFLNQILPVRAIIRLIPRAFYPVAVVVSIAITFVPTTLRQFQQIKEAQAIRGHRLRGLGDWLPLFIPLLVGGLERALQLAEAMMARGFAGSKNKRHSFKSRLLIIIALIAVLSGWLLRLVWQQALVGTLLLWGGIILIGGVLWYIGRQVPRTTYRPEVWQIQDWGVSLLALVVILVFLAPLPDTFQQSLIYYPYPKLLMPGFNAIIALAILGLLGPLKLAVKR